MYHPWIIYTAQQNQLSSSPERMENIYIGKSTEELTLKSQNLRAMKEKTTSSICYQKKIKQKTTEKKKSNRNNV